MEGGTAGQPGEFAGDGLDELVVVQIAGGGEDHVAAVETVVVVIEEAFLVEAGHRFGGAEDRPAEGMILPEALREELVDEYVGVIFVDLDFFQDDATLALDVRRGEDGVQDEVAEDVESDGDVVGEGFDVEADGFFAGEGVEIATDGIHFAGDELRGAGAGSFEEHVLDEVGDAVGFGWLAAGTGFDPDAHGDGAEVFHALG